MDERIDEIIEFIIDGKTYKEMSEILGVPQTTLYDFLMKPEYSARVRDAQVISSNSYADKAEQVLIDAKSNLVEIQRAKELSQHYRWKASKRNPKVYGDKLDVDLQTNIIKVNIPEE